MRNYSTCLASILQVIGYWVGSNDNLQVAFYLYIFTDTPSKILKGGENICAGKGEIISN